MIWYLQGNHIWPASHYIVYNIFAVVSLAKGQSDSLMQSPWMKWVKSACTRPLQNIKMQTFCKLQFLVCTLYRIVNLDKTYLNVNFGIVGCFIFPLHQLFITWICTWYNKNTAWLRDTVRQTSRGKSDVFTIVIGEFCYALVTWHFTGWIWYCL